ncbi:phage portal protein [Rhizobium sp. BK060]|uniref:phage portal protein n=1 Tax=Rhizobium sp. BK060 TaxID=2587096 RepID=UPI0016170717|nr:phage portal protein [Rhizobium sp. BK060]MBB3396864.1 HK97 family phage portal protein [Rhizobium sp. BK060]
MSIWSKWFGGREAKPAASNSGYQPAGGGTVIVTSDQLEEALRNGNVSASGATVNSETAMRSAAVYACVRLIAGAVATLPLDVKRRTNARTREDASDTPLWRLLRRKPNRWQTPSQFRRMMQAHLLLRGNAYGLIVRSVNRSRDVKEIIPIHPDRVRCKQNDDLSLTYTYTTLAGRQVTLVQSEVFHLVGLTFDGVHGVSVLTYAREAIGEALVMTEHGATMFRNGARVSGVLTHPGKLGDKEFENLKASLDEFRASGERDGKAMILEEGMKFERVAMTSADAQWIESRKFTRAEIAMFFGVPPTMIGDNTGSDSNWGTGLEQKSNGFVAYTLEDHLTTWEETIFRDLIADETSDLYARFNRAALVRGDIKTRWDAYMKGRQMKVLSANDVRELEDMNPVDGGDVYENPLINVDTKTTEEEPANEPPNAA